MLSKVLVLTLLGLCAHFSDGKTVMTREYQDQSLHDDIRLTPEQKQELKERGFYTLGKWPKQDGVVTVPYYFDPDYFPEGDSFRNKFREAVGLYKSQTCIEWVEVPKSDPRHKVRIFKDEGCYSYVGMVRGEEQDLSLDDGCHSIGTMLHEMGHCMGLHHTQSRPDRDDYVKPWLENVSPGNANNFDKSTGETFGIPYDYKSMMHYGRDYFSTNGSYTLTTLDPFALFTIGARPDNFRYSDAAFLNKGYDCVADFTKKCGDKNCVNGGFVGKDCNCRCPENTSGARCETRNGPLFDEKPKCGGEVTTERDLTPNGYPEYPTSDKCIFKVQAPKCKLPAFTFTEAKFYWKSCSGNSLALEVSKASFGYLWCDDTKIPLAKTIISETQNANLYFSTGLSGWSDYGFRAKVTFVNDPKCGPVVPTSSSSSAPTTKTTTTTTTSTTTTTTTASSTAAPSTACTLVETSSNSFEYKTLNFPSTVAPGTTCFLERKTSKITDIVFTKLEFGIYGTYPDEIAFTDPMYKISYSHTRQGVEYGLWPLKINYNAHSSVAEGFRVTAKPVTGLPTPCNGEEVKMTAGQIKNISNPLIGMTTSDVRCAFKVTAPVGKKIFVRPVVNEMTGWEILKIAPYLPMYDYFVRVPEESFTSWGDTVKLYYTGMDHYRPWTLELKVL